MNNPIKVTILMPIFKVEQYLEKTLDSVFSQSYSNIDFVFVDQVQQQVHRTFKHRRPVLQFGHVKPRFFISETAQKEALSQMKTRCISSRSKRTTAKIPDG